MRALLVALFLLVGITGAHAQPSPMPPSQAAAQMKGPCDFIQGGCVRVWNTDFLMSASFAGKPMIRLYRDDGQELTFTNLPGSLLIDVQEIHAFADNHETYCKDEYDHSVHGSPLEQLTSGRMPMLAWRPNGMPHCIGFKTLFGPIVGSSPVGGFLEDASPTGIPIGTASRTILTISSNHYKSICCDGEISISSDSNLGNNSDLGGVAFVVGRSSHGIGGSEFFGITEENYFYNTVAMPTGYTQMIKMASYDQPTNRLTISALRAADYSATGVSGAYSWSGTPATPINTGKSGTWPVRIRACAGSDNGNYGCDFGGAAIVDHALTDKERADFFKAAADIEFAPRPSNCMSQSATLTAARPNTAPNTAAPASYGPAAPASFNLSRAMIGVSTVLPYAGYTGPAMLLQRKDTGEKHTLKYAGCGLDKLDATIFCLGTQCGVAHWWDFTGHTVGFMQPYQVVQPVLGLTSVNGGPAVNFTQVPNCDVTGYSTAATNYLTVTTANACTVSPGEIVIAGGVGSGMYIDHQVDGTPGGAGNYYVRGIGTVNSIGTPGTFHLSASTYMTTDGGLWSNDCGCSDGQGPWRNITVALVFQTGTTPAGNGGIVQLAGGWGVGTQSTLRKLQYIHGSSTTELASSLTYTANQAQVAIITADDCQPSGVCNGSTQPQNLTMAMGSQIGSSTDSTTTTSTSTLYGGPYLMLGNVLNNQGYTGSITMFVLFDDLESTGNQSDLATWARSANVFGAS